MKAFFKKYNILLMLISSGLLTGVTLIFPRIGFLQWVSVIPAAIALLRSAENEDLRYRRIYGRGLIYFWSYYAVVFHWFFYMYPLDFAGLSNFASIVVVVLACFGISLLQALISALVFVIVAYLIRGRLVARKYMTPMISAAVWVIAEWFQTVGWWGVPWGRLPVGQTECLLMLRSSAIFGSYFVTFIIVAVNFCLAYVFLHKETWHTLSAIALSLFSLNLALGAVVTLSYRESGEKVCVAALQGNIASNEKWNENSLDKTLDIYEELTVAAAATGAKIVLLPETAIPYALLKEPRLMQYASDLAKDNEVTVLVSAFTYGEHYGEPYNSVIQVKPDGSFGKEVYSKQKLVPFGEYVPMRELVELVFPPLADMGMLDDDLSAGEESIVLVTESGNIGCAICFDSIYENVVRSSVMNGAELIAVSTNDSWFGNSAALHMHNSQSVIRAIENGRYLVRAANTGISSVIDPLGNIIDSLGSDRVGYVMGDVYLRDQMTLYTKTGNLIVYLCIALSGGLLIFNLFAPKNSISRY